MEIKEKKLNLKEDLKIYFGLAKKYKWLFVLVIFFVFLHEVKQILDRFIFKIAIDNATEFIAGTLPFAAFYNTLIILGVVLASTIVIMNIGGNWFKIHFENRLSARMIMDLKQKYFSHIISLDHKFYTGHKTGSLISRLTRGASGIERVTDSICFDLAPLILQFIVLIFTLIYLDKTSALIIFLIVTSFLIFSLKMQKKVDKLNLISNSKEDIEKGNVADIFTNIDSIKYFGKEFFIKSRYKKLAEDTKSAALNSWDMWKVVSAGQSFIIGVGTILLLFFSFRNLIAGNMTIGTITFIYMTYYALLGPLWGFIHGFRNFSRGMSDLQDLFEYGKIESSIKNKEGSKNIEIINGKIEFKNVDFTYTRNKIFDNFNLKIPASTKVALVGQSGSGKTTLVKLLYRLYNLDSGEILIDGKNIADVKHESLRSEMAIVPQECVLFDDTIYNNVLFSNPSARRNEVMKAIRSAQLDQIIDRLPLKENTIVGERGVKLSGGEKQRVSIARALLANKKILVLDEATSSLDSETEYEIKKGLDKLMQGRTSIIIAHRLSTIMHADLIVVLKQGKIIQMGKHNQLLPQGGEYKKLWNLQKGGYIKD